MQSIVMRKTAYNLKQICRGTRMQNIVIKKTVIVSNRWIERHQNTKRSNWEDCHSKQQNCREASEHKL